MLGEPQSSGAGGPGFLDSLSHSYFLPFDHVLPRVSLSPHPPLLTKALK